MNDTLFPFEEVKEKIAQAQSISILTHINPEWGYFGYGIGYLCLT